MLERNDHVETETLVVSVEGCSPLLSQKWTGGRRLSQEGLTPEREAYLHAYWMPDGATAAVPAAAFKAAIVTACNLFRPLLDVKFVKHGVHVLGEGPERLVPIRGTKKLWVHELPVLAFKVRQHRYLFTEWQATFHLHYKPSLISRETVLALVDAAGYCGVGALRPSSPLGVPGPYGTWRLVSTAA